MFHKKLLPLLALLLVLLTLPACNSQILNYPDTHYYSSMWVWYLDVGTINSTQTPYKQTKQINKWHAADGFKKLFFKQFSDHIQERFNALGFHGSAKIKVLRLFATKHREENNIKYDMKADIHFSLDSFDLVIEELWNLSTDYSTMDKLTNKNEKLLWNRMLKQLVHQLHQHTGIKLKNKLKPIILK